MLEELEKKLMESNQRLFVMEDFLHKEMHSVENDFDEKGNSDVRNVSKLIVLSRIIELRRKIQEEYAEQKSLRWRVLALHEMLN